MDTADCLVQRARRGIFSAVGWRNPNRQPARWGAQRWGCCFHPRFRPERKLRPPLATGEVCLPALAGLGKRHEAPPPSHPPPDLQRIRCSPRSPSTGPPLRPGSDRKAAAVAAATEGGIIDEAKEEVEEEAKEEDG